MARRTKQYGLNAQLPKYMKDIVPGDTEWEQEYGEVYEDSYRLTQVWIEMKEGSPRGIGGNEMMSFRPPESKLVGGGSWIMVLQTPPTSEQPVAFGLYWATPCKDSLNNDGYDSYGRYKVDIVLKSNEGVVNLGLFPDEYMVVREELFEEFMAEGYFLLQETNLSIEEPMNIELIERGRNLVEEERESIWALMLDGLPEVKACEEYFTGRMVSRENASIWYMPIPAFAEYMQETFGSVINGPRFSEVNHRRRAEAKAGRGS
jgi:hypothetical protein